MPRWQFWTAKNPEQFTPTPKQEEKIAFGLVLTRKLGDRIYAGTVPAHVKARRRAANRRARAARRLNRAAA